MNTQTLTLPFTTSSITTKEIIHTINEAITFESKKLPELIFSPVDYTPSYIQYETFHEETVLINVTLKDGVAATPELNQKALFAITSISNVMKQLLINMTSTIDLTFHVYEELLQEASRTLMSCKSTISIEDEDSYFLTKFKNLFGIDGSDEPYRYVHIQKSEITFRFIKLRIFNHFLLNHMNNAINDENNYNEALVDLLPNQAEKLEFNNETLPFSDPSFQQKLLIDSIYRNFEIIDLEVINNEVRVSISDEEFLFLSEYTDTTCVVTFPLIEGELQVHFTQSEPLLNLATYDNFFNCGMFITILADGLIKNNIFNLNLIFPNEYLARISKNNLTTKRLKGSDDGISQLKYKFSTI